jgi:penicillin-binding protein 1A
VALPIWIGYMDKVLKEIPEAPRSVPVGVVSVPVMGVLGEGKLAPEFFYQEAVPPPEVLQPIVPQFALPGPPDTGPPP